MRHAILNFFMSREPPAGGGSPRQAMVSNPAGRPSRNEGATRQVTLAPAFSSALAW
jgi:hypothetical protein